jgi:branched-chain amino acid transport system substrate-binding protein
MRDAYKARFSKNPELNTYMVHDALKMVIDAMQRAKSVDPVAIQKALTTCDIQGLTGHIKIGPQHDPVGKDAWLIKVVGPDMKFQEKFAAKN